jgi:hypothetical protein
MGSAEASKNSKNINRLVHAKLPTKQISDNNNKEANNSLSVEEYQAVSKAIINTEVLSIIKGKLSPWYNSNQELAGYTSKPSWEYRGYCFHSTAAYKRLMKNDVKANSIIDTLLPEFGVWVTSGSAFLYQPITHIIIKVVNGIRNSG